MTPPSISDSLNSRPEVHQPPASATEAAGPIESGKIFVYLQASHNSGGHPGDRKTGATPGICLIAIVQDKDLLALRSVHSWGTKEDHTDILAALEILPDVLDELDVNPEEVFVVTTRVNAGKAIGKAGYKSLTNADEVIGKHLDWINLLSSITTKVVPPKNRKSGAWAEAEFHGKFEIVFPNSISIDPSTCPPISTKAGCDFEVRQGGAPTPLFVEVKLKSGSKINISEAQLEKIRTHPQNCRLVVVHKTGTIWVCEHPYDWIVSVIGIFPLKDCGGIRPRIPASITPTSPAGIWRPIP